MKVRMEVRIEHFHFRVSRTPTASGSSSSLSRFILEFAVTPSHASAPLLDHYFLSLGERLSPANTSEELILPRALLSTPHPWEQGELPGLI